MTAVHVEVRAWIPNGDGEVLLTCADGTWQIPGGPACAAESDFAAVHFHVREQTGLRVVPLGPAVIDRQSTDADGILRYHLIFFCARLSGDAVVPGQRHRWARQDTVENVLPAESYRQFMETYRTWTGQSGLSLLSTRVFPSQPAVTTAYRGDTR